MFVGPESEAMNLNELIEQLINDDDQKFTSPSRCQHLYCQYICVFQSLIYIPDYTTRTPEILACKHQIISREEMEQHIKDNELVEYERPGGYYSGTSIQEIKVVMDTGKTCLLRLQPQVGPYIYTNIIKYIHMQFIFNSS